MNFFDICLFLISEGWEDGSDRKELKVSALRPYLTNSIWLFTNIDIINAGGKTHSNLSIVVVWAAQL